MQQLPGRVPHLCVSGLLEAHVDPVVPGDAAHVARQAVAHGHRAEKLVAVEHAPVAVLDDHAVADLALRGDEQRHPLPLGDGDRVVVHEALELGRGHAAARDVVLVEINHITVPDEDASLLVAVGQEEVLSVQSPVEECPVRRLVHHAQVSRLADAQQRLFGRGHQPVLRVVVNEDLLAVADLVRERRVAVREQHFGLLLVREVDSVFRRAAYGECLGASGFEHLVCFFDSLQKYV